MTRPSRYELLRKFFPQVALASSGEKEAARRINTMAAELVLADQIRLFDRGFSRLGPGVLILRLYDGAPESAYVTLEDISADQEAAERWSDDATAEFLAEVLNSAEGFNFEKGVLLMLLDNNGAALFVVDRKHPAASIKSLLEERDQ